MKKKKDINKIHEEKMKRRRPATSSEKDIEEIDRAVSASRRKKIVIVSLFVFVLVIACVVLFVLFKIKEVKQYKSYEIIKENESGSTSSASLEKLTLNYSENGVSAVDSEGVSKWDQGFSMKTPTYVSSSTYGLFYDKGGRQVELVDVNGPVASYATAQEITLAGVSSYGVAAFMVPSGTECTVVFYDKTGRKLDIEVKNVLAESSGYPISMALSPSGNGLVLSLTFLDQGGIKTRISFLNFDVGKDLVDRVVGFYEYDDILFPEVRYIGSSGVVAFGEDRTIFYSLENPASPVVLKEIVYEEEILSVMAGDTFAAVILKSAEGGNALVVYDATGEELLRTTFDFEYSKAIISKDYVLVYGGAKTLITTSKYIKYCGEFDGVVTDMTSLGGETFLQSGTFGSRIVELK